MLWRERPLLERINERMLGTAGEALGIVFTKVDDDSLEAQMPVDERTKQPAGLLHGGASVLLAETLGSVASSLCAATAQHRCVGLEINANHVRGVTSGSVTGTVRALHVGRTTHVWDVRIVDPRGALVCVSRLTVAVLPPVD